jgi:hypothetical protein
MISHVIYSVAGRSVGWVTPCAVCTVHEKMRSAGFLVELQNHWDGLASKPLGRFVSGLASKPLG